MTETIRVIHNFPVWLPQTQTWMYNQVKFLPSNVETHIVCEQTANLDQFYLPNIHCLKNASQIQSLLEKVLRMLLIRHRWGHLNSVIRKVQAQIIHSHFGHIGWIDLVVANCTRTKHIVTFYGADVNKLPNRNEQWRSRYKELFNLANLFLCEGPFMANQLVKLGCAQEKIKVHHLGVDIDALPFKPRHWKTNEPLRILIAASFREKKGIPYALEALRKLQHEVPIEVTLIGDANSGLRNQKEKQRIVNIIRTSGLQSKTRLLGYQPYSIFFKEAYNNHIYLSPSVTASDGDTEGGAPVSMIEVMATGMPVVSTKHCDIPEVVQYGIPDWLVEERNVAGLVAKLMWLIENPNEWKKLVTIGRRHVETRFDASRQGSELSKIYYGLVANGV